MKAKKLRENPDGSCDYEFELSFRWGEVDRNNDVLARDAVVTLPDGSVTYGPDHPTTGDRSTPKTEA